MYVLGFFRLVQLSDQAVCPKSLKKRRSQKELAGLAAGEKGSRFRFGMDRV